MRVFRQFRCQQMVSNDGEVGLAHRNVATPCFTPRYVSARRAEWKSAVVFVVLRYLGLRCAIITRCCRLVCEERDAVTLE